MADVVAAPGDSGLDSHTLGTDAVYKSARSAGATYKVRDFHSKTEFVFGANASDQTAIGSYPLVSGNAPLPISSAAKPSFFVF
jgi:hypothetical protein